MSDYSDKSTDELLRLVVRVQKQLLEVAKIVVDVKRELERRGEPRVMS